MDFISTIQAYFLSLSCVKTWLLNNRPLKKNDYLGLVSTKMLIVMSVLYLQLSKYFCIHDLASSSQQPSKKLGQLFYSHLIHKKTKV